MYRHIIYYNDASKIGMQRLLVIHKFNVTTQFSRTYRRRVYRNCLCFLLNKISHNVLIILFKVVFCFASKVNKFDFYKQIKIRFLHV